MFYPVVACTGILFALSISSYGSEPEFSNIAPGPIPTAPAAPAAGNPSRVAAPPVKVSVTTGAPSSSNLSQGTNANASSVTNMSSNITTNGMDALDDNYKLAIGDKITYQVKEDDNDPISIVVSDSGDIQVPYLGPYSAAGKTCKQLAKELKVLLEKNYYYQATVIISVDSMATKGTIYLVGAVRSPGPLEMPRDDVLTVSKAILRMGGLTDFADGKNVRVTRKTESGTNEVFTVNISAVLDGGKLDQDQTVEPGDLIFVPEKTFNF
jgi:polysaccharide export outer membrane protein